VVVSHDGIIKVAFSWTLHGWIPPWTRTTITLYGLKSPSTWTYDRTTYQDHAKIIVSSLHLKYPTPPLRSYAKFILFTVQLLDLHV